MDLYIRTQNKEQLIKIEKDITITDVKKIKKMLNFIDIDVMNSEYDKIDGIDIIRDIYSIEGYSITTDKLLLGTYKTKGRALEVLDELQNMLKPKVIIQNIDLVPTISDLVHMPNEQCQITPISDFIVYEMPKE